MGVRIKTQTKIEGTRHAQINSNIKALKVLDQYGGQLAKTSKHNIISLSELRQFSYNGLKQ